MSNFFDRKKELLNWLSELNDEHLLDQIKSIKDANSKDGKKRTMKPLEDIPASQNWL